MQKLLIFSFVSLVTFAPQLHSISLAQYRAQHGELQIQNGTLDLSGKNLTDINALKKFPDKNQVETLDLSNNQLKILPKDIFNNFRELRVLKLRNNQLGPTLPETIFHGLPNLVFLMLDHNELEILPENIFSGLDKLTFLSLDNNQLYELPEDIFNDLTRLTMLSLKDNPFRSSFITKLAAILDTIPHLIWLDDKAKDQALKNPFYSTLKNLAAKFTAQNIEAYRHRLHELPSEILDLLPLTSQQRAGIAAQQRQTSQ